MLATKYLLTFCKFRARWVRILLFFGLAKFLWRRPLTCQLHMF